MGEVAPRVKILKDEAPRGKTRKDVAPRETDPKGRIAAAVAGGAEAGHNAGLAPIAMPSRSMMASRGPSNQAAACSKCIPMGTASFATRRRISLAR